MDAGHIHSAPLFLFIIVSAGFMAFLSFSILFLISFITNRSKINKSKVNGKDKRGESELTVSSFSYKRLFIRLILLSMIFS